MKERSPHLAILSGAMNVVSVVVLLAQVGIFLLLPPLQLWWMHAS